MTIGSKLGPLLTSALSEMVSLEATARAMEYAAPAQALDDQRLPAIVRIPVVPPIPGEGWERYRARVYERLEPVRERFQSMLDAPVPVSYAANALQVHGDRQQLIEMAADDRTARVELDPLVQLTALDDSLLDVGRPAAPSCGTVLDGSGVRVAVLDSGVDAAHPALTVADAATTCGESVDMPGRHGTHCAGIVASRDAVYPGVAPNVTLINIKVMKADGRGRPGFIARGIDAALDARADVLSMSLGFNHLPVWSDRGHGWLCPAGKCELCLAVTNAVISDGVIAVVAAGNEHDRAEALRRAGIGGFDTELACPGQATSSITVAALSKRTRLTASFSSRGPSAFAGAKPDLAAPGVNIMSTVPVPREPNGTLVPNPQRALLFGRDSGTSMATPFVAGAAALVIQRARQNGVTVTPDYVRNELLSRCIGTLTQPATEVGAGYLDLRGL